MTKANLIRLEGAVTMRTADVWQNRTCDVFATDSGQIVVDFANVTEVDSAALALILGWLRIVGKRLVVLNVPGELFSLAQLYDLDELLPLQGRSNVDVVS